MKKKLLSLLLALVMLLGLAPAAGLRAMADETGFKDVPDNAWYADAVKWAESNGIMYGVGGGRFDPQGRATRAMIVTILWRIEGEPEVNEAAGFTDVADSAWYAPAVRWAAANKIVSGLTENTFGPSVNVSREQLATILHRYMKAKGRDVSVGEDTNILSYDDAFDVSDWAMSAMCWACGAGLIHGKGEAYLAPQDEATRAEIASIFMRWISPNGAQPSLEDSYVGVWVCGRAQLEIARSNSGYKCYVTWSSSAAELSTWEYDCDFDGESLYSFETGVRTDLVYNEDGAIASAKTVFSDGAASFSLGRDGTLSWIDYKTYPSSDPVIFERVGLAGSAPSAEEYVQEFFNVIGSVEQGTSGASLKMAQAAYDVYRFASVRRIWCIDTDALRSELLKAWESMTDEERAAFDANFIDMLILINNCPEDFEPVRGPFDDAGIGAFMGDFLRDPIAAISWDKLSANTLTLGNSDGE